MRISGAMPSVCRELGHLRELGQLLSPKAHHLSPGTTLKLSGHVVHYTFIHLLATEPKSLKLVPLMPQGTLATPRDKFGGHHWGRGIAVQASSR